MEGNLSRRSFLQAVGATSLLGVVSLDALKTVQAATLPPPMPWVSRGLPAYASSGTPSSIGGWRSRQGTPSPTNVAWLAFDMSSLSAAQKQRWHVGWTETGDYQYDLAVYNNAGYNQPRDYTIDMNAAPGGAVPAFGWVTKLAITGNTRHGRQHLLDVSDASYNWVRIAVTAINGTTYNYDANAFLQIRDAASGPTDGWSFFGDSITANAKTGVNGYGDSIHAFNPSYYPFGECCGIGGWKSGGPINWLPNWLDADGGHAGRYIALSFGTNDANGNANSPTAFHDNMDKLIQICLTRGKIVTIPTIVCSPSPSVQQYAPALNDQIRNLWAAYPSQLIPGPDLWSLFQPHATVGDWFVDSLHPNSTGSAQLRQAWVNTMTAAVY